MVGARRATAAERDRHRRGGAAHHSWHLRCGQSPVWLRSLPEISLIQRGGAERVRPSEHDLSWATPHAEYARRGTDRACRGAIDGLRPDGSHVCHHATGPAWLRATDGGRDVRALPPCDADPRWEASGADLLTDL